MRSERGIRRPDLARAAGSVSYTHLSEIENGKKEPSGRTLEAIASGLGVRPHDILARADTLLEGDLGVPAPAARTDSAEVITRHLEAPLFAMRAGLDRSPSQRWEQVQERAMVMGRADREPPDRLRAELLRLARDLPPEDVQRLVDLARRLRE